MTDLEKYKRYSEKVRIFNGLTPEEVDHILHQGKITNFNAGMTVFHEGTLGSSLFVVLKGEVAILHHNEMIAKCVVGDAFGEMAVLNHSPRSASASALTDCRLFALDEKELNNILRREVAQRMLMNVIHILSERLEAANARNHDLRTKLKHAGVS